MILFSSEHLKARAVELGFNLVGVIRAAPSPAVDAYLRWVKAGMYGAMNYLARPDRLARRQDLNEVLPGVQSMILVGLDYRTLPILTEILDDPSRGRFAAYAWHMDYHDVIGERLSMLASWLIDESGLNLSHRIYVDTGAVLERSHGQQAGLGFIGKNTMLIHPRRGSYFFIGEILTDLEFDIYDLPHRETMCGTCTRCLSACPTKAFPEPFVLDARRCISYLTIEHKGWIDRELRPLMGNWVFGCDICQDVCPWQRFAVSTPEHAFYPQSVDRAAMPLVDLLMLDDNGFRSWFKGSPVYRIKRERLVRNACIAAGNWRNTQVIPLLMNLMGDTNPLIRGHAVWALWQIAGEDMRKHIAALYERESDAEVRREIDILMA